MVRTNIAVFFLIASLAAAASRDRITGPVDLHQLTLVPGHIHSAALPKYDQGPVDDSMRMDSLVVLFKPASAQQADLDSLLSQQQNPASQAFHKWLTPDEFGNRFGLSSADNSRVVAWLHSQGLEVREVARGRNWISFGGTAGRVSAALHTSIHHFQVDGKMHYANAAEPSVPSALSDVVGGFLGLNDFPSQFFSKVVTPDYTVSGSHYLAPPDFATIYDLTPLYSAGIDGTGQSIVVVGESDIILSDLAAFRTRYNLPANTPKQLLYNGVDPGFTGALTEAMLDMEWAGAIAPKATLVYVFGTNATTAIAAAVNANLAPIITSSYGGCEIDGSLTYWRAIAQQANAQGITILNASGDSGAASCDAQGYQPFASRGRMVSFPSVLPEVTAVGGTQFVEGTGTYWSSSNSSTFGSALSYIPEAAWNETSTLMGLLSSGGGASQLYAKPVWQTGSGVPNDGVRDVPDVSLSAALHDAYYITIEGNNLAVGGTSCATPAMAGVIALLNQYQVTNGYQKQPGLGNVNPQLYRMAQIAPSAFHDIISGSNVVPCLPGSPDCTTGSFGYLAGPGYDQATGLGSVDANNLITLWNTATKGAVVTLSFNSVRATVNDTIQATAVVTPATGSGTPTGTVNFSTNGVSLGSATLGAKPATVTFPLYLLGTGIFTIAAEYSGDAAFGTGGATATIQVSVPAGAAAILPTWPDTVWPGPGPDAQGMEWQTTLSLSEVAGVGAVITSFTIDGTPQSLAQYFPAPSIVAKGTVTTQLVFHNLNTPVTNLFAFSGIDAAGNAWSRQVPVNYMGRPLGVDFNVTVAPAVINQDTSANSSCQWSTLLSVDDLGGSSHTFTNLFVGSEDISAQIPAIFGTPRLEAWGSLQGKVCFPGVAPPASDLIGVIVDSRYVQSTAVTYAPPPANPATLSASPSSVTLAAAPGATTVQSALAINISDKTQYWSATILPTNRGASWLSASQLSGTGPAQITLVASGVGYEPGVYRALLVIQSTAAMPQSTTVPIMFVLGASNGGTSITSITGAGTTSPVGSPGMLMSVYGTKLANSTPSISGPFLPYSAGGVSATVNGIPASLLYVSPSQINLEIPFEVGVGPAVVGINNNGQIAGFLFQTAASSPTIAADAKGNLLPSSTLSAGGSGTLYVTGGGITTPGLVDGEIVGGKITPVLPLSVTIGGVPVFLQFVGLAPGMLNVTQVNFTLPPPVPSGGQPVVVTIGGNASQPVTLTVK